MTRRFDPVSYQKMFRAGAVAHSPLASLRVLKTGAAKPSQVFFVVAAKELPRAVDRNFVKRRGRSIVRSLSPLPDGFFAVFFIKRVARQAAFEEFKESLVLLLKHLGMR